MLATDPPTENTLAIRAGVIRLVRLALKPLFESHPEPDSLESLDALPAWLWSLPTSKIVHLLECPRPENLADCLADAIDNETDRRHPTDRFVAFLERHQPLLSATQRCRLAEFACALKTVRANRGAASSDDLIHWGFLRPECERLREPANALIAAMEAAERPLATATDQAAPAAFDPVNSLRVAGDRAHARRAFADGSIDSSPIDASRRGHRSAFEVAKRDLPSARATELNLKLVEMPGGGQ